MGLLNRGHKCDLDLQGKGHSAISETVVCRKMILICSLHTHSKKEQTVNLTLKVKVQGLREIAYQSTYLT